MAFHSKAIKVAGLALLLGLANLPAETKAEPSKTLAEKREQNLELRYRNLLGRLARAHLSERNDLKQEIALAKKEWDQHRKVMGLETHDFGEDIAPIKPWNDLDKNPVNIVPNNENIPLGALVQTQKPTAWIKSKLQALKQYLDQPSQTPNYILSRLRNVDLEPPESYDYWRFWQFRPSTHEWTLLRSGKREEAFDMLFPNEDRQTYAFTSALKHPSKIENLETFDIEIDLSAPQCQQVKWQMNEDGYRKLSWNFTDKNMAPQHVMAVLESKKKEMSLFVVEGGPKGSLVVEPHKARWIEGISLVSFDLAGNEREVHFGITR